MAVLTNDDFAAIRRNARRDEVAKRAYLDSGLSKAQWKGLMQGLDDWFESERLNMKAAMVAGAGVPLTNALAKKMGKIWLQWKYGGE